MAFEIHCIASCWQDRVSLEAFVFNFQFYIVHITVTITFWPPYLGSKECDWSLTPPSLTTARRWKKSHRQRPYPESVRPPKCIPSVKNAPTPPPFSSLPRKARTSTGEPRKMLLAPDSSLLRGPTYSCRSCCRVRTCTVSGPVGGQEHD